MRHFSEFSSICARSVPYFLCRRNITLSLSSRTPSIPAVSSSSSGILCTISSLISSSSTNISDIRSASLSSSGIVSLRDETLFLQCSSIEYAPSVSSSPDIAVCALYRFSLMYSALRSSSIFCFTVSSSSAEKLYLSSSSRRSLRSSAFSSDSVFLRLTSLIFLDKAENSLKAVAYSDSNPLFLP